MNDALARAGTRDAVERLGGTPMPGPAGDFAAFVAAEIRHHAGIIRVAGIRPG